MGTSFEKNKEKCRSELGIEMGQRIIVASMAGGQGAIDIWKKIYEALNTNRNCFDDCFFITGPYLEYDSKKILTEVQKNDKKIIFIPFPQPCHFRQRLNYCQKMLLYEFI